MRVLVPLLFVLIGLSLLLQLLYFIFVVHFEEVVATVVITAVVASISFCVYKLRNRGC
jgi:Kef-type K+ transport system membrane component KefB